MTEKKNETSTDKFETGCGCLFMLVPAFIVYCLLSAFLVFPAGWNVSEVFENKVVHKVLMVLLPFRKLSGRGNEPNFHFVVNRL